MPTARQALLVTSEQLSLDEASGYAFGQFTLFPRRRVLLEAGKALQIGTRALDLLIALVEAGGELISSEELMAKAWPNVFVEEANLRVHIGALRRMLGDNRGSARYIKTVHARGYFFAANVRVVSGSRKSLEAEAHQEPRGSGLPSPVRTCGRNDAIEAVTAEVRTQRLITLVGAGGIGKTTVAVAVARAAMSFFEGGAYFVDLGSINRDGLVVSAMASTVKVQVRSEDPLGSLLAWFHDKHVLVVLDNCEHVIAECVQLVEGLLADAAGVSILATSREPLRARAESVHRLTPLGLPPSTITSAAEALTFPAVELFVERARASSDSFELLDSEAHVLVEICRRLDGIPLAIELAAATVSLFGVRGLATRLDNRFSVLTRGQRTALPRQQTLRATFEWSRALLSEPEQVALRRLAVFRGAFTFEAASEVVGFAAAHHVSAFTAITGLIEKSLISVDLADEEERLRLLDSTRSYALELLTQSGELQESRFRHARYLRRFFEQTSARWDAVPTAVKHASLRRLDDLRSAMDWAFAPGGDTQIGLELTVASVALWCDSLLLTECCERVAHAITRVTGDDPPSQLHMMKLCTALGMALYQKAADSAELERQFKKAHELAEKLGDPDYRLRTLWGLWLSQFMASRHRSELVYAERFVRVAQELGDPVHELIGERLVAVGLHVLGDQRAASVRLSKVLGHKFASHSHLVQFMFDQRVTTLAFHARILWLRGKGTSALRAVEECLSVAESLGHASSLFYALVIAGCPVSLGLGEITVARRAVAVVRDLSSKHAPWRARSRCYDAVLLMLEGDERAGFELLREALSSKCIPKAAFSPCYCWCLGELAASALRSGDIVVAREIIDDAVREVEELETFWCLPELLRLDAEITLAEGAPSRESSARQLLQRALNLAGKQGALIWELRAAMSLAALELRLGDRASGQALLLRIYRRFREGFELPDLRSARHLLARLGTPV